MSAKQGRTIAEWVTFATSCLVLAAVVALIVVQLFEPRTPPAPTVSVAGTRQVGDRWFVDVVVTNEGKETAAEVQVAAQLTIGEDVTEGDQTVDFLAGSEEHRLVFTFDDDPASGELSVTVSSFSEP
jgi:uncharacterized protein (TIGR02588 family)